LQTGLQRNPAARNNTRRYSANAKQYITTLPGGIPASITSPILFRLIASATLMMRHEIARRIAAVPGTKEYGILAVQMQAFCDVKQEDNRHLLISFVLP